MNIKDASMLKEITEYNIYIRLFAGEVTAADVYCSMIIVVF